QHAPSVNQQTLVSVNQHRHHQPRRDILILFVARLSSRLSRHSPTLSLGARRRKTYLVSLMDDASRLIAHSAFCVSENALEIEGV
ncbi:hypothetical protein GWC77_28785, partial [Paraburkholderia sp. NMBU_R16]|nr:hypothetical protein [Paraburkholderia sp. NMBU_R16]